MLKSYMISVGEKKMVFTREISFGKLVVAILSSLNKTANMNEFTTVLTKNVDTVKTVDIAYAKTNQDIDVDAQYAALTILYKQKMIIFADDKYSFVMSKTDKNFLSLRTNNNGYVKIWSGEFVGKGGDLNRLIESYFNGICFEDTDPQREKKADVANAMVTKINHVKAQSVAPSPVQAAKTQVDLSINIDTAASGIKEEFIPKTKVSTDMVNELLQNSLLITGATSV